MKSIDSKTQRSINGGCAKNVYCPVCGRKVKVSLFQRLFVSTAKVEILAANEHALYMNFGTRIKH
ncbi:MAG: hypothetical protein ACI4JS_10280 [Oscillospiraceae bacterium]